MLPSCGAPVRVFCARILLAQPWCLKPRARNTSNNGSCLLQSLRIIIIINSLEKQILLKSICVMLAILKSKCHRGDTRTLGYIKSQISMRLHVPQSRDFTPAKKHHVTEAADV